MIEYLLTFLILIIFVFYDFSKITLKRRKIITYVIGLCMILITGLRWNTGTDWENYYYYFQTISQTELGHSGFEFLFDFFVRNVQSFTDNYTWVLVFTAIIIIACTYKSILMFSPYPIFSIFLLFTYSFNSSGFGYRQDIAIAITTLSVIFVHKRKFFYFFLLVYIASLFHQSALIFLIAYWIPMIKWNKKTILVCIVGVIILGLIFANISSVALLYSDSAHGKVGDYTSGSFEDSVGDGSNPYIVLIRGILNRAFILIFIIVLINKYVKKEEFKNVMFFFNLYLFGFLLFLIVSPIAVVFVRFTRYFDMFFIILIPLCLYYVPPKIRYNALIILLFYTSLKFFLFLYLDDDVFVPYDSIIY